MLGIVLKYPIIRMPKSLTEVRSIHGRKQKYFKHDRNMFSAALTIRTFLTRCTRLSDGIMQPASFLKPNRLPRSLLVRYRQTSHLDVNMNVQNNVILYKNERSKYFRNIRIFAIAQLFSWAVLASYTYPPAFFEIFTTDIKFKEYVKKYGFRLSMFMVSIITGPIMYIIIHAMCARSVKYIILNKGGKTLSFITYHMWSRKSRINVPVGMVKYTSHRTDAGVEIPLKVENRYFYYLLSKNGIFPNPKLLDYAMG